MRRGWLVVTMLLAGWVASGAAQAPGRVYTAEDYARAERLMQYNVDPLVDHTVEHPVWLADGRMWYRNTGPDGVVFTLVDAVAKTVRPAFDHARLAAALNAAIRSGRLNLPVVATIEAGHLPIDDFSLANHDEEIALNVVGHRVMCRLGRKESRDECSGGEELGAGRPAEPYELSPDGQRAVFIRNNNLWLRELASGKEMQLTGDGLPNFGYATDNAGWRRSANPIVVWSPDSKKLATFRLDLRRAGRMELTSTGVGHPGTPQWRYPLAGDDEVAMVERVIVDVDARRVLRLRMAPDYHRGTLCDDLSCTEGHGWDDVQWSADSTHLAFVSTARDHRQEWLRIADAATGEVREVFSETGRTFLESGVTKVCWRYLSRSNEILWFSQRDDWGNLYLYDAATGALKRQLTTGVGNVTELVRVDESARTVLLMAVGREASWDPYDAGLYRLSLDSGTLTLLTPVSADHTIVAEPGGRYFLDLASTTTTPQVGVVRDAAGRVVVELPRQSIARLQAIGWKAPEPITVKARDGRTGLYGMLFKPTDFNASLRYPVVDFIYPGPQTGSCGTRSFIASHKDMQSLAELGFVVVCIDGMGTPMRSKSFHDALYGNLGDNTIPDQVAGIRELAKRYAWIDGSRVGIYGHSGGGAAAAAAMFHFPEFFSVGVSESGNHDNRVYEDDWAEKWQGLLVRNSDGTTNYDNQANELTAGNLKGHLLLVDGTMDDNVPPANTMLVVRALMDANKDFDLLLVPNAAHAYGAYGPYVTRRRWDYFVRYLAGGTPPAEYTMRRFSEQ
jgi:dipeptidyl aminopeptidase/acylaminoacyl peptidase